MHFNVWSQHNWIKLNKRFNQSFAYLQYKIKYYVKSISHPNVHSKDFWLYIIDSGTLSFGSAFIRVYQIRKMKMRWCSQWLENTISSFISVNCRIKYVKESLSLVHPKNSPSNVNLKATRCYSSKRLFRCNQRAKILFFIFTLISFPCLEDGGIYRVAVA